MRGVYTITIDVQDNELAGDEEARAEEFAHWVAAFDEAIAGVMRDYHRDVTLANTVRYQPIDFTNVSHRFEDEGDYDV